ncbi:hypothetical protein K503DRAFT_796580 [Rhizopogon vinicolor AM-OR11-026]|uniref:Uncharacterized protein n=1 Tax=Rhizopogon vinicolor AM-OR11-026 TaxID=1314800 RepID=A0A1B7NEC3_9AGAM|nr:hypothetical protein K503DRAFT_796580 [Rhizopogon vinicolor AM-OR11-026]
MALVNSTLAPNLLISEFAGRIVYHLSASNWLVVFYRIRQLVQVLHELSSLLVNMKRQGQAAEFNEAVRSRGKLEGASECVLWPTLTILACLAAERLSPDYQIDVETRSVTPATPKPSHRKDIRYTQELIRHSNTNSMFFSCAQSTCVKQDSG